MRGWINNKSDEERVKITNLNKDKRHQNLRGKPKSGKKPRSHTNPLFHREFTWKMKENLQPLNIIVLNFHAHTLITMHPPFIKIIKVTSCEITKQPLTCSSSFAGKEASRLTAFRLDWAASELGHFQQALTSECLLLAQGYNHPVL